MIHEVKLEDFQEWLKDTPEITFASSSGGNYAPKRLTATVNGNFKVYQGNVIKYEGLQAQVAVEVYNGIY